MIGEKRGSGAHWQGRNRPEVPAGGAESGELFRQPGGTIWRGKKGKMERRGRDFIGRSRGGFWCLNLLGINSGQHSLAAEVTAALMAGGGRRLTTRARVSGRERGGRVPFRAEAVLGRGRFSGWAEMAPLSPFLFFFVLSSFLFLFSYFLYNFCINSSNNVKPISNLF
jgi:hypothetical protein